MQPPNPNQGPATTIAQHLTQHSSIIKWGFVLVRCTYGPEHESKWTNLLALAKQRAREHFEACSLTEAHEKMEWTVIEDAARLDGASIEASTNAFCDWNWEGEGRLEQVESKDPVTGMVDYTPRYLFYLHVDEEGLEGVRGGEEKGEEMAEGDRCVKVVRPDKVVMKELQRTFSEENREEYTLLDLRKKVRVGEIVELYAALAGSVNGWDSIVTEDEVCRFY